MIYNFNHDIDFRIRMCSWIEISFTVFPKSRRDNKGNTLASFNISCEEDKRNLKFRASCQNMFWHLFCLYSECEFMWPMQWNAEPRRIDDLKSVNHSNQTRTAEGDINVAVWGRIRTQWHRRHCTNWCLNAPKPNVTYFILLQIDFVKHMGITKPLVF